MANEYSKETKVRIQSDNTPHFSKVSKVSIVSGGTGGGGGEFDGTMPWDNVTGKPDQFAPSPHNHDERYSQINHNHDDRYNTKEQVASEIDFVRQQMIAGQGRVATSVSDEPDYLDTKIDNTTITVEGTELVVKGVDGLTVGAADISAWLAGTTDNVQTQIDEINDSLVAMTSGMNYIGKLETYAELQGVGNKENGNLAVVLADESRSGGRSMYVYSENLGAWEFIGEFTFTDEFTALKDTPTNYAGADGKVVKVAGERLVFSDVEYGDLSNKPESTITQIDDAVAKRHEHINGDLLDTYNQTNADLQSAVSQSHTHSNKSAIDRIGINASGQLTIDGVPYVPAVEPKGYLYARASSTSIAKNGTWRWNRTASRGITLRDNGVFVLEEGKTYQITVNASVSSLSNWKRFDLIDTETRSSPPEAPNSAIVMAVNSSMSEAHSGVLSLIITPTSTRNFGIAITSGANADTMTLYGRTSLVITEI